MENLSAEEKSKKTNQNHSQAKLFKKVHQRLPKALKNMQKRKI